MTADPPTLWHANAAEPAPGTPLRGDTTVDLAVIGGGFTGCAAALEASSLGASACVLEASEIGHGGSGRNVGLVNAGLWLPPDDIVAALGEDAALCLIDLLARAPDRVFDLIARHRIDCAPVRAGTLHCAHAPKGMDSLRTRLRQGNRFGAPLRLLDANQAAARTGATGMHGALFDPRAGILHPLSYARGLARAALQAGARVHTRSPVRRIARDGDVWRIDTPDHSVSARHLLLATNAYHKGIDAPMTPHFAKVGYAQFATAPLPHDLRARILPGGEGCWDTARVMTSFRLDDAGRLILGCIGDLDGPGGRLHATWARTKLRALFPDAGDMPFTHQWTGQIAMTGDHIPKIVAFGPNALSCFGYSGRGIGPGTTFGTLAARALLRNDPGLLPIAPVSGHAEPFATARAAFYEFGASATHVWQAMRGT